MDWDKVGKKLAKHGLNLLSSTIPGGTAIAGIVADILGCDNTPEGVDEALGRATSEQIVELKKYQMDNQTALQKIVMDNETARIESVNRTMRAESKSEHWLQWSWRPLNGLAFGLTLFCNYGLPAIVNSLVFPWFSVPPPPLASVSMPPEVMMAWGAIMGVTSWFRGKEKVAKVENKII